ERTHGLRSHHTSGAPGAALRHRRGVRVQVPPRRADDVVELVVGVLRRQVELVLTDPRADAFNAGPTGWAMRPDFLTGRRECSSATTRSTLFARRWHWRGCSGAQPALPHTSTARFRACGCRLSGSNGGPASGAVIASGAHSIGVRIASRDAARAWRRRLGTGASTDTCVDRGYAARW